MIEVGYQWKYKCFLQVLSYKSKNNLGRFTTMSKTWLQGAKDKNTIEC